MLKLNLEQYLKLTEFFNNKNVKDFKNYKKKFYTNHKEYDNEKQLNYLLEYYATESINKDESQNIIETISIVKKIVITLALILGLLVTFLFFSKEINIKIYILTSIILPFIYLGYLAYRHFSYDFPSKDPEISILNWYVKNKFKAFKFTNNLSYVIKTYSTMLWIKSAIFYAVGVLIATIIIFSVLSVTFYSGTTYGANDYQHTKDINQSKNLINNQDTQHSSAYWSRVITTVLIVMIILKIGLYFLARRNNIKTIKQALINQGEEFFNILKTSADIGLSEYSIKEENRTINQVQSTSNTEKIKSLKNYHILYYQIDLEEQSKIEFNISNKDYLKNKTFNSYSYGLFGKKEEDISTLKELNNLVIIYTSPQTIPDDRFKKNMIDILKSNVTDIWIIPLKDENGKLELMRKDDKDYNKWNKMIVNINNNHIRIHFDV
jgi:hypothetical protein